MTAPSPTAGLHHVTALASDAQRNLDFYAGILGLRLVKRTVNFDDPGTYHLYYGDALGRPGTLLTFFPIDGARSGRSGPGQATAVAFAVPEGALGFWMERLIGHGVRFDGPARRFGEAVLRLADPDGTPIELVFVRGLGAAEAFPGATVPPEAAIHRLHGVTLTERDDRGTRAFLTGMPGFRPLGQDGELTRFGSVGGSGVVDVRTVPGAPWAAPGAGTIHHVALRADDLAHQSALAEALRRQGTPATTVRDRRYFHSVYLREPGGVLFEIATDLPGFARDEAPERLGEMLMLPPELEVMRTELERDLPPLHLPGAAATEA
ncbi:MAG: ring-cleaving dioxygenase [Gemmatimonadales bacterium]|nr:ring-cleaving dioxygenase [Gemmatimonadales bacterium]